MAAYGPCGVAKNWDGERSLTAWLRPAWAEINLGAIAHNTRYLVEQAAPAGLMAVVKANAYGHGALPVAQVALANGASQLAVAIPEEGLALRAGGITAPILVLGAFFPGQEATFIEAGLTATVIHEAGLRALSARAMAVGKAAKVQIKVDTGMGRLGVLLHEAPRLIEEASRAPGIRLEGVYTHLATADEADLSYAREQLDRLETVIAVCGRLGVRIGAVHAANTAALLQKARAPELFPLQKSDWMRAGIALYGLAPSAEVARKIPNALRPALTWKAQLVSVKRLPSGSGVSYGLTYRTASETTIGVVPVGYADGYSRLLSGKAEVLIGGQRYPVVGRICMDQFMIDLGDRHVEPGAEVTLLGRQGNAEIPAEEVANWLGTIPYEVVCMIGARVPRVYVNE